jgi:hypothetical protein
MHFNVCDKIYSKCSNRYFLAPITAIFRVILLLHEYKSTNVVNRDTISTQKLKL